MEKHEAEKRQDNFKDQGGGTTSTRYKVSL